MRAAPLPYFFIVNPRAGLGGRTFAAIASQLRSLGVPYVGAATTGPGDARVLAQLASRGEFRAIVVVGGDGTVNDVVNGLATADGEFSETIPLGVIPTGTAQDFARSLGIPLNRRAAVERLLDGQETAIDVGRIVFGDGRTHLFVNVFGAGFDAEVAERAQDVRGAMTSIPAHMVGLASAFAEYRNQEITITLEDAEISPARLRCVMVIVANGPSYAGVLRLAPNAIVDDGLLDLVVIGDVDKFEMLMNLGRVFTGTHLEHAKVEVHRTRALRIESTTDLARVQADGEVVGRLPARVDVLAHALRVIR
jgi:diacylglycerol kinase (ATP)